MKLLDLLKRLFKEDTPSPVSMPLVLEEPPEWGVDQAQALARYLASANGQAFKMLLMYDAQQRALAGVERTAFEQGVDAGKNRMLAGILNLSDVEKFSGMDPADKEQTA